MCTPHLEPRPEMYFRIMRAKIQCIRASGANAAPYGASPPWGVHAEAFTKDPPDMRSVSGGNRYDLLCSVIIVNNNSRYIFRPAYGYISSVLKHNGGHTCRGKIYIHLSVIINYKRSVCIGYDLNYGYTVCRFIPVVGDFDYLI